MYNTCIFLIVFIIAAVHNSASSFLETTCSLPADNGYECQNKSNQNDNSESSYSYFNKNNASCVTLKYLGCGGNSNKFSSSDDCIDSCQTSWLLKYGNNNTQNKSKDKSQCFLPPDSGNCKALIPMWYYDSKNKLCNMFNYSGCKSKNENRFDNEKECMEFCKEETNATVL